MAWTTLLNYGLGTLLNYGLDTLLNYGLDTLLNYGLDHPSKLWPGHPSKLWPGHPSPVCLYTVGRTVQLHLASHTYASLNCAFSIQLAAAVRAAPVAGSDDHL